MANEFEKLSMHDYLGAYRFMKAWRQNLDESILIADSEEKESLLIMAEMLDCAVTNMATAFEEVEIMSSFNSIVKNNFGEGL